MKKLLFPLLFLLLTVAVSPAHAAATKSDCNPQPAEGDIILPGPEGTCFAFRAVKVRGETPFSGVTFVMGDPEEDSFRMPSTEVMVGGSFFDDSEDPLWLYYLGKYEITRKQYRAIMGEFPAGLSDKEITPEKDALPITNLTYFETVQFIDKLNRWLYANALDAIPKSGDYPGFVRLPSEAEWEFAARGGMAVEKSLFESPTPYGDKLSAHEWFNGPKSSHGKMKSIGLLKPNPLGFHDMLGNVQEMAANQYQFEYYQGRSGGFTSRGGSFIMAEDKLSSAQRQEEPYYLARRGALNPNAKLTLGVRLAISAPLLTDRDTIDELEEAWEPYRTGGRAQTPAGLSMAPLGDQAIASFKGAFERIQALRALPEEQYSQVKWKQELAYAIDGMLKGQKAQEEAQRKTMQVLIGHTHTLGQELLQHFRQFALLKERFDKMKEGDPEYASRKRRLEVLSFVITSKLKRYGENIVVIDTIPAKFIAEGFAQREKETQNDIKEGMTQEEVAVALQVLKSVQSHYTDFTKNKRTDLEKWRTHYENSTK